MARIIGGIATSLSPTLGFALDTKKQNDPVWKPISTVTSPFSNGSIEKRPDVLFIIYNDHGTSFFFDHYSHFALGVGDSYSTADEGGGPRRLPPVAEIRNWRSTSPRRWWPTNSTCRFSRAKTWTTAFSPLSMLWPHDPDWPGTVVPLQVGVLLFPFLRPGAATSWASRCAERFRVIRRTFRWPSSPRAACHPGARRAAG